jgi:hypothetical protein
MLFYNMLPNCDNSGAPVLPLWPIGTMGTLPGGRAAPSPGARTTLIHGALDEGRARSLSF